MSASTRTTLPPLHPDRVQAAIRWFEIERGTFGEDDIVDVGAEYDTALAALKAMRDFQKAARLTPGTVDTVIQVREFFDQLKKLTAR